ncbi:hypothetical protein SS37_17555 [Enterobacter sichuanensis]|uniref:Uncharacterized protein n=1 Tax=Enterobacter sichuanensis TaxID=2071710 RepID=A0A0F1AS67_9ENTR|nr:hypothetical protein SS37_17555 [Enterobacter sichuanensis]
MDTDHFPQHQPGINRRTVGAGQLNALRQAALKIHRALRHARRLNKLARRRRQSGKGKLIPIVRKHRGRLVHRFSQIARGQVPDKLPCFGNITHAVLPAVAGKTNDRRTIVKAVKEAVRCEVQLTGLIR